MIVLTLLVSYGPSKYKFPIELTLMKFESYKVLDL